MLLNMSESGRAKVSARPGMTVVSFKKADASISINKVLGGSRGDEVCKSEWIGWSESGISELGDVCVE